MLTEIRTPKVAESVTLASGFSISRKVEHLNASSCAQDLIQEISVPGEWRAGWGARACSHSGISGWFSLSPGA
jgi:hypothetical protein